MADSILHCLATGGEHVAPSRPCQPHAYPDIRPMPIARCSPDACRHAPHTDTLHFRF